jgi:hypothetical protein
MTTEQKKKWELTDHEVGLQLASLHDVTSKLLRRTDACVKAYPDMAVLAVEWSDAAEMVELALAVAKYATRLMEAVAEERGVDQ